MKSWIMSFFEDETDESYSRRPPRDRAQEFQDGTEAIGGIISVLVWVGIAIALACWAMS